MGVADLWASAQLGAFPDLTRSGWLLFPPVDELVLARLSALTHVGVDRMVAIQTPAAWVSDRSNLPYCFECLVLNPFDIFSPRWKREWLNPAATACEIHGRRLETIPSSTLLKRGNLNAVISRIGRGAGPASEAIPTPRRHATFAELVVASLRISDLQQSPRLQRDSISSSVETVWRPMNA
ncbi:hypothetical protein [Cupriavidus sp. CP313]